MKQLILLIIGFLGLANSAKASNTDLSKNLNFQFTEESALSIAIDEHLIEAIVFKNLCNPTDAPKAIDGLSFEEKKELLELLKNPNLTPSNMSVEWVFE